MTVEHRPPHLHSGRRWEWPVPKTLTTGNPILNTRLIGPTPLRYEQIRGAVDRVAPGAFALGYAASDDGFCVLLVGRSDTDVKSRLIDQIGTHSLFKYILSASPMLAFEKECELFHDFTPPYNRRHPQRAPGSKWTCPRCRWFGS